jgi:hypothetical protein
VRTIRTDDALAAGTYTFTWNGRNDAGSYVPRGSYWSRVTATDGADLAVAERVSVRADAFRIAASDSTPSRGQRITVTVTTAEGLSKAPRVGIYQPGIAGWTVSLTKVSSTVYKATVTLKSSATGSLRLKAYGWDSKGAYQWSQVYLPLH